LLDTVFLTEEDLAYDSNKVIMSCKKEIIFEADSSLSACNLDLPSLG